MYLWDEEEGEDCTKSISDNTIITTAKLQALTFLAIARKVYIMRRIKKTFLMVVVKSANHWHPNRQSLDSAASLYCMLFLERWGGGGETDFTFSSTSYQSQDLEHNSDKERGSEI